MALMRSLLQIQLKVHCLDAPSVIKVPTQLAWSMPATKEVRLTFNTMCLINECSLEEVLLLLTSSKWACCGRAVVFSWGHGEGKVGMSKAGGGSRSKGWSRHEHGRFMRQAARKRTLCPWWWHCKTRWEPQNYRQHKITLPIKCISMVRIQQGATTFLAWHRDRVVPRWRANDQILELFKLKRWLWR